MDPTSGPRAVHWARELWRQVGVGTGAALVSGAAVGLVLGVGLALRDRDHLMLADSTERLLFVVFLAGGLGLAGAVALLPVEVLISRLALGRPRLSASRLRRFYTGLVLAGAVTVYGLLLVFFRMVRDPVSVRGASLAGLVVVAAVAVAAAVSRLPIRREIGRGGVGAAVNALLLVLCLVACLGAGWALRHGRDTAAAGAEYGGGVPPAGEAEEERAARPLDVILISIDTLRADHLGCYGYSVQTSPNIDSLGAESVVFEQARSQAPWTLPSHASLFTSLYPSTCGVELSSMFRFSSRRTDVLASSQTTLAEVLSQAGYRTAAYASVLYFRPGYGLDQGFDLVEVREGQLTTSILVERASRWLETGDGRPSFLVLHLFDVHEYAAPGGLAGSVPLDDMDRLERLVLRASSNLFEEISEGELELLEQGYDASIRYVDREIGRLVAWLKAEGRWDRTLIVLTSDHGEEFWDHGGMNHGFTLYDEQLHVPLIVRAPAENGRVTPLRVGSPVGLIDVMPTVLDLVGVEAHRGLQGRSLRPLLQGEDLPRRLLFAEATFLFNRCAVIDGGRKLIVNRVPPRRPFEPWLLLANLRALFVSHPDELFKLAEDPEERINHLDSDPGVGPLREAVVRHLGMAGPAQQIIFDEEEVERLRELGYVR